MSAPEDALPNLGEMRQQLEKLLGLLRTASADLPPGPESEIAGSLAAMLTTAGADFFPAAESMQQDLERLRSAKPAAPGVPPADTRPDQLGPRLRHELLGRYPPAPTTAEANQQESLWREQSQWKEESLWKSME